MVDIVDAATRSRMMSGIRNANTTPERCVRTFLHHAGLRFRLHVRNLPGTPDIVLPKYRTVVFVHGCFWHRHTDCQYAYTPKSRLDFWQRKFASNVERDSRNASRLRDSGWRVLTIWECQLRAPELNALVANIKKSLPTPPEAAN
jgi:DNA mismatch endonuclease (patch repair protein)